MAKTTKAPVKRATAKQNKKSKQVGIFGKSFDLKSRKVQFFVSIFIIAILGGGYFTFKSFAATQDFIYTADNGYLNPETKASTQLEPKKNNIKVIRLDSYGGTAKVGKGSSIPVIPAGQNYQYCVTYSMTGIFANSSSAPYSSDKLNISHGSYNGTISNLNAGAKDHPYLEKCTGNLTATKVISGPIYVKNQNNTNPVKVSIVKLKFYGDPVPVKGNSNSGVVDWNNELPKK